LFDNIFPSNRLLTADLGITRCHNRKNIWTFPETEFAWEVYYFWSSGLIYLQI